MKKIQLIIAMILSLLIVSCTQNQSAEPIRIGALFPLTGGLATYGEAALTSAQMAAEEINAAGGINGKPVEIDFQDHQCDPKIALAAFQELHLAKGIKVFTSAACSGTVLAIAPTLVSGDAIIVGTIVTTPKITGVSPYLFRNWASDAKQAKLYADEVKKHGYKKIGIIFEQTDYAAGLKTGLVNSLNGSNIQVASESFDPGTTDVRTQLSKLKDANVDMLFVSPQTESSGDIILKQMQELGFGPKALFVNDNVLKMQSLMMRYKTLLQGATSADYVLEDSIAHKAFLGKYRSKYGKECIHTNICAGVYDAVHVLAQAIREKGENPSGIREYLQSVHYTGVSGTFGFDANNDRTNAEYTLFTAKDGKAVRVK